jgi:hypothetical protein
MALSAMAALVGPSLAGASTVCTAGTCTATFSSTGSLQSWTVPSGVTSAIFSLAGAGGGAGAAHTNSGTGGSGGKVISKATVTPGTTLTLLVGGAGGPGGSPAGGTGGFGGGGAGSAGSEIGGGGGGGGSFLFSPTGTLLIAAAGGGGHGATSTGGGKGGKVGTAGDTLESSSGGGGATASAAGGGGGGSSTNGKGPTSTSAIQGFGGEGATGASHGGGGGGGGYYGGGGGGAGGSSSTSDGGGGGGSEYVAAGLSNTTYEDGAGGKGGYWHEVGFLTYGEVAAEPGALTITFAAVDPIVSLQASPSAPSVGQTVAYSATVSPAPSGGTVAFTDGGVIIPTCEAVTVSTTTGKATCTVTYGSTGSHVVKAAFSGTTDEMYASSTTPSGTEVSVTPVTQTPSETSSTTSETGHSSTGTTTAGSILTSTALPSNVFTIGGESVQPDGTIVVKVTVPAPGEVNLIATHTVVRRAASGAALLKPGYRRLGWGRVTVRTNAAGRVTILLHPNRAGRQLIARHRRYGWALHLRVWTAYTPAGGTPREIERVVTVLRARRRG